MTGRGEQEGEEGSGGEGGKGGSEEGGERCDRPSESQPLSLSLLAPALINPCNLCRKYDLYLISLHLHC